MDTTAPVIVLTTLPSQADADALARALVDERLAACVNVLGPMRSVYRWQGAVDRADEQQLVVKTTAGRLDSLEQRLKALHPHDVPEFLVVRVEGGSADYLRWLLESCQ